MRRTRGESACALRGLWLARELPFPADMGDKIYSGNLAKALAEAGADLTFVGLESENWQAPPAHWPLKWNRIPGRAKSSLRALFSTMPLVAASYATAAYRARLRALMRETWDFVVFDQYGLGWALEVVQSATRQSKRPILIHVAHDHEASVCESLYRGFRGPALTRLVLWQNYIKAMAFERAIASQVDLVTAITEEDATKFSQDVPGVRTVVLKPGFSGAISSRAVISETTPRRVILVGSFRWIAKQENLRRFVEIADPIFAQRGIEFQVVGAMPAKIAEELKRTTSATCIVGFAEKLEPILDGARIAVVPEEIGGGFKLKLLDYIFGRVPVATLIHAAAGLPREIRQAMLCSDNLVDLASGIAELVDNLAKLNAMQEQAFRNAESMFRWSDRGKKLLTAINECIAASSVESSRPG